MQIAPLTGPAVYVPESDIARVQQQAVFINADPVCAWFDAAPNDDNWGVHSSRYGPHLAPFPSIWLEGWERRLHTDQPERRAWAVDAHSHDDEQTLSVHTFILIHDIPYMFPITEMFEVDRNGVGAVNSLITGPPEILATIEREKASTVSRQLVSLAFGFMNCRNVRLDDAVRVQRHGKKGVADRRRSFPAAKVINVPGMSSAAGRHTLGAGEPIAPHVVRGHFKNYTEDAPLLGKITGTYWWGHHVRGGAEAVPKQYRVAPSKVAQ